MAIRQWDFEVLVNGEIVEQMILLKYETDLLVPKRRALFRLQMIHRSFAQKIFALPAVIVHPEDVQQRRFPGGRRSHDRDKFAFGDIEIDIAQDIEKFLLPQRVPAFETTELDHNTFFRRASLQCVSN